MRRGRAAIGRAGFTLIELLTTMVVLSILAAIAIPTFRASVSQADARKLLTDVSAVRTAVFEYREDADGLPATAGWATVPPELEPYLNNVDFTYKTIEYRLEVTPSLGRVDLRMRYAQDDPIASALQPFARPGSESGSVVWTVQETRFRLLEDNQ